MRQRREAGALTIVRVVPALNKAGRLQIADAAGNSVLS